MLCMYGFIAVYQFNFFPATSMSLAENSLENTLSLWYSWISNAKYNIPSSELDHLTL